MRESLSDEQVAELMADDMLPEYDIDYSKARPNRFAGRGAAAKSVTLDANVAAVFAADGVVNTIRRAHIQAMPQITHRETSP